MSSTTTVAQTVSPSAKLSQAREQFLESNWEGTIAILAPLMYPTRVLARPEELTEAHLMLGVSYFETANADATAHEFEAALRIEPDLTLNPDLYSPEVIEFFIALKHQLNADLARTRERAQRAAEWARYRRIIETSKQVTVQQNPYYINFLPFGAGQFQNGHRKKGTALFASELLLSATSLAMFTVQWTRYGIPLEIPADEITLATRLQDIQVVTGLGFFILYAAGVADALWYHEPRIVTTTPLDPSLLPPPPDGAELPSAPTTRHRATARFLLLPLAGPSRAGLGLHWEF